MVSNPWNTRTDTPERCPVRRRSVPATGAEARGTAELDPPAVARRLSRRRLAGGLGGLGLLLASARVAPFAAAQGAQPQQCGGNPGVEALLAYSQGTLIPRTLLAADPRWPYYMHPAVPTISFRYPPDWRPVNLPAGVVLLSPQENALVAMGSASASVYVPMEQLLDLAMGEVFTRYLAQPAAQPLCGYQLGRSAMGEYDFAAAQNRTTLAAATVTATYTEGTVLDANLTLVPTTYTTAVYYAAAGPREAFADLTETVFFPIFGQLLMTGGGTGDTDDDDEDGDTDEGDDDWGDG